MGAARVLLGAVIAVTAIGCSEVDRTRIKAHLGGTDSQIALANRYAAGRGVEKDEAEAVRWYRRAAEGGYGPAQVVMGNRYLQGAGVEADPVQARAWFRRAAEGGDPSGEFQLGILLIQGVGGDAKPEEGASSRRPRPTAIPRRGASSKRRRWTRRSGWPACASAPSRARPRPSSCSARPT
jgi:hypothetical protein